MRFRRSRILRVFCIFTALNILFTIVWPTVTYALTAGPNSPEFSTFTPVATTDMVNVFSGDFNYNLPVIEIPGSDGGGYALSLSYNSGVSSEQEASWVGFGWTLNPGSINRTVRGFPDDYNGLETHFYNKTRPNWTSTVGLKTGIEILGQQNAPNVGLSASNALRFNNYTGYFLSNNFGIDIKGYGGLTVNQDQNGLTFTGQLYIQPLERLENTIKESLEKAKNNVQSSTQENIPENDK